MDLNYAQALAYQRDLLTAAERRPVRATERVPFTTRLLTRLRHAAPAAAQPAPCPTC